MSLTIFAQRMKQSRENKGLKQNELAKIVGLTPTTISAYEKSDDEGNGKKPTLENAHAIAKALEVSLDWLCGKSTNYERIKDMSVEEMTDNLFGGRTFCPYLLHSEMRSCSENCDRCIKQWLESEVVE